MRNERTSKRVARFAGEILAAKFPSKDWVVIGWYKGGRVRELSLRGATLNALAASCLTQAPDKPKRKKKGRNKRP